MSVKKTSHSGTGLINQRFPIWDFGAWLYWNSKMGSKAQLRGGEVTTSDDFVYSYSGASVSDPFSMFVPGKGRFVEYDFGDAFPPVDGHFEPERANTYDASLASASNTRGPFTFAAGLLVNLISPYPGNPIVEYIGGVPSTAPFLTNLSAGTRRMYKLDSSSAVNSMIWSILIKRNDGGIIDSNTCIIGASSNADPFGSDLGSGSTRYDRIREDGWYRCSRIIGTQSGAPPIYFWVQWAAGITNALYEAPQVEQFNSTIEEPTSPLFTGIGNTFTRNSHILSITGGYKVSPYGWMGATIVPLTNAADLASGLGAPQSDILTWRINDTNRLRIIYSSADDTIKFVMESGGSTQVEIEIPQDEVLQGVPMGVVATWGTRGGSKYSILSVNGIQKGAEDSSFTQPSGAGSIFIGSKADSASSVANVMLQHVAFGNTALDRNDVRTLSKWFETAAFSTIGRKGE